MMNDNNNSNDDKNIANVVLLLVSVFPFIIAGILLPSIGRLFSPYLLVWLGVLLFLNLIRLELRDLVPSFTNLSRILVLSTMKILVVPLVLYAITNTFYPIESLPILLLSGISTGLGAPFVVNFVGDGTAGRKELHLVVGMIIVTSLAVPFTLPSFVYLLFHQHFSLSLSNMIILLSTALFIPLGLGWLTKRYLPKIAMSIDKKSLPLSMIVIVLINFGMFARFSSYFYNDPLFVINTILLSSFLFVIYGLSGYGTDRILKLIINYKNGFTVYNGNSNHIEEKGDDFIFSFISMSYINNILVAVFAEQFFGPKTAALAAFYNIPYYVGIFFIKRMRRHGQ
jgi:bile acid:Na+ symporter, BASS family